MSRYHPEKVEAKWQKVWQAKGLYEPDLNKAKKPFYNLMMFPYPSAEGLHVGNMYAFTGADVYGRFTRMQGRDVFEPIGLDGFGIHSENHAIKIGDHPQPHAQRTQQKFYDQLSRIGNGFAWSHKLETYDPSYYRWTQWIFVQLFKNGLAYRKKSDVNWCPSCKTVLADEQVIEGRCERCEAEVERKKLAQWFFRITRYADRLLKNLDKINWTEKVKIAQRNWIGKSTGAEVAWLVDGTKEKIWTFTTRLDTIFGATFLVVAPDHPLLDRLTLSQKAQTYRQAALKKTEQKRKTAEKEKTGIATGLNAIHPLTGEKIPVWTADFVLMEYGTGAIMGVPAHDERDYQFATKYDLPIKLVVKNPARTYLGVVKREWSRDFDALVKDLIRLGAEFLEKTADHVLYLVVEEKLDQWQKIAAASVKKDAWHDLVGDRYLVVFGDDQRFQVAKYVNHQEVWEKQKSLEPGVREYQSLWEMLFDSQYRSFVCNTTYGPLVNSGKIDGLSSEEGMAKILASLEKESQGRLKTTYHLRDWLISRQRYWGPPIPMVYCQACAGRGQSWFSTPEAKKRQEGPFDDSPGLDKEADWAAGWYPVPEKDLPVKLPHLENFKPTGTGEAPLAQLKDWLKVNCPGCRAEARREADVSDTFLDSAWYFLRYPSVGNDQKVWDKKLTKKWLPVDMYIGGAEHSVLHLLYSRFLTMVFADLGLLEFDEPFPRFYAHGLLIREGAKISKSKGNIIVPDDYLDRYGADTFRTYLMFLGPFHQGGDFRDTGIAGTHKFIQRVWRLAHNLSQNKDPVYDVVSQKVEREHLVHKTIKEVTNDLKRLRYNTAIAKIRLYVNHLEEYDQVSSQEMEVLLKLLAPFAPFITEELWELLGHARSIHTQPWPTFNPALARPEKITIIIQVNGKLRGTFETDRGRTRDELVDQAKQNERVAKHLKDKQINDIIVVPDKLVNFVTGNDTI